MSESANPSTPHPQQIVITGMGRSGSVFLGGLLDQAPNVAARHERLSDKHLVALSYYRPDHPYVAHTIRRRAEAVQREQPDQPIIVHVDPGMRHATEAVERCLGARCFHLVRDGRRVVQSMYPRKVYTERAGSLPAVPEDAATLERWDAWPRFEKLCWYWRDSVDRLLQRDLPILRLEDIVKDFDVLDRTLLEPTGIELSRQQWDAQRSKPANATRFRLKWLLPQRNRPLQWTDDHERRFRDLCGDTMARLGYALD